MSEEILGEVESGQGENLAGSFFAIFGEEPASAMEISHQQVLFKSRYSNLQWSQRRVKMLYFQVASKLLSEGLLLTALELHTELLETGRELPRFDCRICCSYKVIIVKRF